MKILTKILRSLLPCSAFACLLFVAPAHAARPALDGDEPVKVTADNMTYQTEKNVVVFSGNVEVQRGPFQLWAATVTMHLMPGKASAPSKTPDANADAEPAPAANTAVAGLTGGLGTGDIDRIIAEKNVKFRQNTQTGSASKATYTAKDGVLLLEGDPVLRDGDNSITGHSIRYFTAENRSEVVGGGKKRVEAVFSSKSSKKGQ